ncbi:uncharacterized protein V6R79_005380 [Siganus canaliculatus]
MGRTDGTFGSDGGWWSFPAEALQVCSDQWTSESFRATSGDDHLATSRPLNGHVEPDVEPQSHSPGRAEGF